MRLLFCMSTGGLASLSAHVCGDYKSYPVYQEHSLTMNMWAELRSTLQLGFIK